jgi:hypothetical protein
MAYFIFLKSLRSLGEFRKNPHVKIPPKCPCANFQSIGIFKNQILFGKEFSHHFQPSRGQFFSFQPVVFLPPPPHWGSASQLAQPTLMAQPATFFLLPHRSQARTAPPAGLAPPPRSTPTPPPEEKKWPHQSPINRRHFPSSITGNRRLQPGPLKLLQAGH